jgi:hypothetical protein
MFYNPDCHIPENHPLYVKMDGLPDEDRWQAMELFGGQQKRHDFCVCRADRPTGNYRIDFAEPDFAERAIPLPRGSTLAPAASGKPAILSGSQVPPLTLPPPLVAIHGQIDARRSIRQCIDTCGLSAPPETLLHHGLRFFRALWRTGHIAFRLKT